MIIDYTLHEFKPPYLPHDDMKLVSKHHIFNRYFTGDVILCFDNVDFSAKWKWITLVDFFSENIHIINSLNIGESKYFEFIESDNKIFYEILSDKEVKITCTYAEGSVIANRKELSNVFCNAAIKLRGELTNSLPSLQKSQTFLSIFEKILDKR